MSKYDTSVENGTRDTIVAVLVTPAPLGFKLIPVKTQRLTVIILTQCKDVTKKKNKKVSVCFAAKRIITDI